MKAHRLAQKVLMWACGKDDYGRTRDKQTDKGIMRCVRINL